MNVQLDFREAVDEATRANWRLDAERSYARFSYAEISRDGLPWYRYTTEIEIKPYPNPYSFGGIWGNGSCETREELEARKQELLKEAHRFIPHGLVNIKIQQ